MRDYIYKNHKKELIQGNAETLLFENKVTYLKQFFESKMKKDNINNLYLYTILNRYYTKEIWKEKLGTLAKLIDGLKDDKGNPVNPFPAITTEEGKTTGEGKKTDDASKIEEATKTEQGGDNETEEEKSGVVESKGNKNIKKK